MRLKEARLACGLTQQQVANALEVDQSAVSHWERGENVPLEKYKVKLAALLNVPDGIQYDQAESSVK